MPEASGYRSSGTLAQNMSSFLSDIASTHWWIAVFLVGIVINLVSHLITVFAPTLSSRIFGWIGMHVRSDIALIERIQKEVADDPQAPIRWLCSQILLVQKSIVFGVLAIALFGYQVTLHFLPAAWLKDLPHVVEWFRVLAKLMSCLLFIFAARTYLKSLLVGFALASIKRRS